MHVLAKARDGFNPSREVGDGGFERVYSATLADGRMIAVKKLCAEGIQGKRESEAQDGDSKDMYLIKIPIGVQESILGLCECFTAFGALICGVVAEQSTKGPSFERTPPANKAGNKVLKNRPGQSSNSSWEEFGLRGLLVVVGSKETPIEFGDYYAIQSLSYSKLVGLQGWRACKMMKKDHLWTGASWLKWSADLWIADDLGVSSNGGTLKFQVCSSSFLWIFKDEPNKDDDHGDNDDGNYEGDGDEDNGEDGQEGGGDDGDETNGDMVKRVVVAHLWENTDEAYRKIKLALEKTQSKQKKAADRHRRELVFSLGDWVLLRFEKARLRKMKGKERLFPKLGMRYYGPFQVCDKISDVAYRLKLPEGWKIHNAFHVSLQRPFVGDVPEDMVPEEQPEVEQPTVT
ncbi:hypothetical protein L7F22_006785 [Adiantum nelumboides]|nr:hypothetical protein [Adiantum nelumboides]